MIKKNKISPKKVRKFQLFGLSCFIVLFLTLGLFTNNSATEHKVQIVCTTGMQLLDKNELIRIEADIHSIALKLDKEQNMENVSREIEAMVHKNKYVRDIRVFKTNNNKLRVEIAEEIPIAKWLTSDGSLKFLTKSGKIVDLPQNKVFDILLLSVDKKWSNDYSIVPSLKPKLISVLTEVLVDTFFSNEIQQIHIDRGMNFLLSTTSNGHILNVGQNPNINIQFAKYTKWLNRYLSNHPEKNYYNIDLRYDKLIYCNEKKDFGEYYSTKLQNVDKNVMLYKSNNNN